MSKPRILLANDDGIAAAGIQAFATALREIGDLWMVAPDREQSASSHSISLHKPLRIREVGPQQYSVDGTPTDCVYVALHHLLKSPPDIVVSGINHGPNLGNDVIYSGTVSAAMEGAIFGYSAMAVSLCLPEDYRPLQNIEEFRTAAEVAAKIAQSLLAKPLQAGVVLNVNVPFGTREKLRGLKLCRLGYTDWANAVVMRNDPRGRPYYWIGGERSGDDAIEGSDNKAVLAGYVSLTPIHYDISDYRSFQAVRKLAVEGLNFESDILGDAPLPYPRHPHGPKTYPKIWPKICRF